ncbi:MAG: molybdenum cofactor guanylyltransferase [Planctomycetota bacterium]
MSTAEFSNSEDWSQCPIYGGVLIGGASKRMGQPKSILPFQGASFTERILTVLREQTDQTVLLGDGAVPIAGQDQTCLPDVPDLRGPLAGILAALRWKRDACWIIVACDLPKLRAEALTWLIAQRDPRYQAILPRNTDGRAEPLLAIYEPESLDLIEQLVQQGLRAPSKLADQPRVHTPTPPASILECWTNINTPAEYRRLQKE